MKEFSGSSFFFHILKYQEFRIMFGFYVAAVFVCTHVYLLCTPAFARALALTLKCTTAYRFILDFVCIPFS